MSAAIETPAPKRPPQFTLRWLLVQVTIAGLMIYLARVAHHWLEGDTSWEAARLRGEALWQAELEEAYLDGKDEAAEDVENGVLALKTYGLPAPWRDTYADILRRHYRIELRVVSGCCVLEKETENVRGYNEVVVAAVEEKHGAGVLGRAAREAQHAWQARAGHLPPSSPLDIQSANELSAGRSRGNRGDG